MRSSASQVISKSGSRVLAPENMLNATIGGHKSPYSDEMTFLSSVHVYGFRWVPRLDTLSAGMESFTQPSFSSKVQLESTIS